MGREENEYWNPNKFGSLRDLLKETLKWESEINTPKPWQGSCFRPDPCFIEVVATTEKMTVAEALRTFSPEVLKTPAGENTDTSDFPVFLEGEREPRYWVKRQSSYDREMREKQCIAQRQQEIQEKYPNAHFYLCEFLQDLLDGHVKFSSVIAVLEHVTDRAKADQLAEISMNKRMRTSRGDDLYNGMIVARLAATPEEARAGHFLDGE